MFHLLKRYNIKQLFAVCKVDFSMSDVQNLSFMVWCCFQRREKRFKFAVKLCAC